MGKVSEKPVAMEAARDAEAARTVESQGSGFPPSLSRQLAAVAAAAVAATELTEAHRARRHM